MAEFSHASGNYSLYQNQKGFWHMIIYLSTLLGSFCRFSWYSRIELHWSLGLNRHRERLPLSTHGDANFNLTRRAIELCYDENFMERRQLGECQGLRRIEPSRGWAHFSDDVLHLDLVYDSMFDLYRYWCSIVTSLLLLLRNLFTRLKDWIPINIVIWIIFAGAWPFFEYGRQRLRWWRCVELLS